MPIEFDNSNIDLGGVDDRRGGGGGMAIGGGVGIVGLIVGLLFYFLTGNTSMLGVNSAAPSQADSGTSSSDLATRCAETGALTKYTDCRLVKVYNINTDVWSADFAARGYEFTQPGMKFFSNQTQTGCGAATSEVGPFYCPADHKIYLDLDFLDQLQKQFGAQGDFAQAYIVSHEYGHHLQSLLGIEPQVRTLQEKNPSKANQLSVAMELQADCFAGAWSQKADQSTTNGINLTQDNIAEAMNAASAVGDDRIQKQMQGRVTPESWTHGSAEQRQQWFGTGYKAGSLDACNTFKFYGLTS